MKPDAARRAGDIVAALNRIARAIDLCRLEGRCDARVCGAHAVGKPTYHLGPRREILVVGGAPGPTGWWLTGCAFYSATPDGRLHLSRTGANLNECLAILGTRLEDVGFVEAVRCRPMHTRAWSPGDGLRRRCLPFLREHVHATSPRVILPLGSTATASCLELAGGAKPARLEDVIGQPFHWIVPWGESWILPLYHPSAANNGRWPANKCHLARFAKRMKILELPCL